MNFRTAVAFAVLMIVAVVTAVAEPQKKAGGVEHKWTFDAAPKSRFVTAWASYRIVDGKVDNDIEYGGGGSDQPMAKPVAMKLTANFRSGSLRLVTTINGQSDRMTMTIADEGKMHDRGIPAFTTLTDQFQIAWAADWITKDGRVVRSFAYVVRVMPVSDKSEALNPAGLEMLKQTLASAAAAK